MSAFNPTMTLVEIDAYTGSATSLPVDPTALPLAGAPLADVAALGLTGDSGITTLRYSDLGWCGEGDDPGSAHVVYPARVAVPLAYEKSIPLSVGSSRISAQFGAIDLLNADGGLDWLLTEAFLAGRAIRVMRGVKYRSATSRLKALYSSFSAMLTAVVDRATRGVDVLTLELADASLTLAGPAHTAAYGGTGGMDGGSDLAGVRKPLSFGSCQNVAPALLDATNSVYQVHIREIQAIAAVRDRGLAITLDTAVGTGGDVASYAALIGATITAGKYATCLDLGLFRLASAPAGQVTCDVEGDAVGTFAQTIGDIAVRFMTDFHGIAEADIDTDAFDALPTTSAAGIHLEVGGAQTGADVLDMLLIGALAWWGGADDGRLTCGRLIAPTGPADRTIQAKDIISIEPVALGYEPIWRQSAVWARNWHVQTDFSELVPADDQALYGREGATAFAADTAARVRTLSAIEGARLATPFTSAAGAEEVCALAVALYGARRQCYSVKLDWDGTDTPQIGEVVSLSYGRYGLNETLLAVIGVNYDLKSHTVSVNLWG